MERTPGWCSRSLNSASTVQPGPARTVALGAAALDDKPGQDAVEREPVVEPLLDEGLEVLGVLGGDVFPELDGEGAFGGFDACLHGSLCPYCFGMLAGLLLAGLGALGRVRATGRWVGLRRSGRIRRPAWARRARRGTGRRARRSRWRQGSRRRRSPREGGVVVVEVGGRGAAEADEDLGAVGIGIVALAGHRDDAEVVAELAGLEVDEEAGARPARSRGGRRTG